MNLIAAITLASLIAAPVPNDEPPKDAKESIQGEWKMVSFSKAGELLTKEELEGAKVVITGDKMLITFDRRDDNTTFVLDPKANPPAIDIKPMKKGDKEIVVKGIYKLEKDKLTICFGVDDVGRPKEFKSDKASKTSMFVLERAKK